MLKTRADLQQGGMRVDFVMRAQKNAPDFGAFSGRSFITAGGLPACIG
jgi:hypothetical protein